MFMERNVKAMALPEEPGDSALYFIITKSRKVGRTPCGGGRSPAKIDVS